MVLNGIILTNSVEGKDITSDSEWKTYCDELAGYKVDQYGRNINDSLK